MKRPDDDLEMLLPSRKVEPTHQPTSSLFFKCYVIVTMTFLWTGYTITVRYTRSTVPQDALYSSTSVVLSAELIKLVITFLMFFKECNYSSREFSKKINNHFVTQPKELLKMSVPSIAYALQNNLDFVGLSNLDAGLYQVTTQLKVVTTAVFMMIFLGREFSTRRWLAILMLMAGVACVQMNNMSAEPSHKATASNYFVGISAVLATCMTAGFAGVYFEKMLKDGGATPFWIRNMQMYSCGVISASIACLFDWQTISSKGFFYGYDEKVYLIVGFLSCGGLYISLVVKYLDNLHKSFASAISIILVVILSLMIFDDVFIGAYFVIGTFTAVTAVVLYNSVPN